MMKIIGWMLNRMVAVRFFGILIGISFFVLSLDVLTNAKELQALRPNDMTILLHYMLYRAPSVLVNYMGISMLLAMLLSLTELSYRNEMAAMWAAGLSPARLIIMLLPLAVFALRRAIPAGYGWRLAAMFALICSFHQSLLTLMTVELVEGA